MRLLFLQPAEASLLKLRDDPTRQQLYERINDALDQIEDNPNNPDVRKFRYQTPPIWGIKIFGSNEDWLILWNKPDQDCLIHYIGPGL